MKNKLSSKDLELFRHIMKDVRDKVNTKTHNPIAAKRMDDFIVYLEVEYGFSENDRIEFFDGKIHRKDMVSTPIETISDL